MLKSVLNVGIVLFLFSSFSVGAQAASETENSVAQTNKDSSTLPPDTVFLNNGQTLKGKVIGQDDSQIIILFDYGTLVVPMSKIKSVQKKSTKTPTEYIPTPKPHSFSAWRDIIQKLTKTSWVRRYQQIPATVIDVGTLRDVPYISFRVNDDYELNIYGDPDDPAGIEMGVYHGLVNDDGAKNNCMNFIAGLFSDSDLKLTFDQLKRDSEDKKENGVLTFEITPPSASDSYGGWWITVYKSNTMAEARASKKELESITIARTGQTDNALADPISWTASDIQLSRPAATYQPPPTTYSNTSASTPATPSYDYSTGTGRVYVKGYFRKDGTYVEPHTRSRPRK